MVSAFVAFVAALSGMLLYGIASVAQAYAARRATGADVLRHPAYAAGLLCDGLAWVASVVALSRLPIFVVQSLLAGSLGVTVLMARVLLKVRLTRAARVCVGVVTLGLVLIALAAGPESARPAPSWFTAGLGVLLGVMAVAALALYRRGRSIPLAVAGALAFSGSALGARAWHPDLANWVGLLQTPRTWLILAFGILGAVLYARSLERGPVGPATATLWVVEVVFPGAIGLLVLGDRVRDGFAAAAVLGVVLAVGASVGLAMADVGESGSG
jgi:drug/metabolite transporter (DMT)-like permease